MRAKLLAIKPTNYDFNHCLKGIFIRKNFIRIKLLIEN